MSAWWTPPLSELAPVWRRALAVLSTLVAALRVVLGLVSGVWLALAGALDGLAAGLDAGWTSIDRGGAGGEAVSPRLARVSRLPAAPVAIGLAWGARALGRATGWHVEFVRRIDTWAGAGAARGETVAR